MASNGCGRELIITFGRNIMSNKLSFKQTLATLVLFAMSIQMGSFSVFGQSLKKDQGEDISVERPNAKAAEVRGSKIAPDLEERTSELSSGMRGDETQKVIIQLKSETGLNDMMGNNLSKSDQKALFALEVQNNKDQTGILIAGLANAGGRMKKSFYNLGLVSAELPLSKIRKLAENLEVAYISPDLPVSAEQYQQGRSNHVMQTVNGGDLSGGIFSSTAPTNGDGLSIAILDSGIDANQSFLRNPIQRSDPKTFVPYYAPRIRYSKDFTGQGTTDDLFGHGTHVASMVGADARRYVNGLSYAYYGTALRSDLLNLRVLDEKGQGFASNIVAAIDWAITNKGTYNIKVLNMSLGTVAKDSYTVDPMCLAARRAHNAGILVVASAGNNGKDANGRILYGGISSPGIEPSVLTVGAVNTFGTDDQRDDKVATFSSRGPTRGWKMVNGVKKFDNLIKPNLVAPGNKLVGGRATASLNNPNSLVRKYPSLDIYPTLPASDGEIYLSGTSMAAPIVAGAAASLIAANQTITPNLAKAILMYTAYPIQGENTFEQGTGLINMAGATDVALRLKPTLTNLKQGNSMLSTLVPALPNPQGTQFTAAYIDLLPPVWDTHSLPWGKGVITNYGFLWGNDLINLYQGMYAQGKLFTDATPFTNGTLTKSSSMVTAGVNFYSGIIQNNGVLVSDGVLVADGVLVGDGTLYPDGVLVGDGVLVSDGVLVADGFPKAVNTFLGDDTTCMQPAPLP